MDSSETPLRVMRLLESKPEITQRQLARELSVSVGHVNYCLKALVEKGWVKMDNFSRSENKLRYAYLLTPSGLAAKTKLTARFLMRKMEDYENLKEEIAELRREVRNRPE